MGLSSMEDIAQRLNGRPYGDEVPDDVGADAAEAGLLILFGRSDDLLELRGAVTDEMGQAASGLVLINHGGFVPTENLKGNFLEDESLVAIHALWNHDPHRSWVFHIEVPHAPFEIMEDGMPFCRGVVFERPGS